MSELFESEAVMNTTAILIAIIISGFTTYFLVPPIMKRMGERGIVGRDWNKRKKAMIPELGGIAILFGFPVGIAIAAGYLKLVDSFYEPPILAAIGVLYIGGMIGIIDDISVIPQRVKAVVVAFAALPLMLARFGDEIIDLPFGLEIDLTSMYLIYWLILVPLAVSGASNAMNMSAGYNGLETGQIAIISFSLLGAGLLTNCGIHSILIFASLFGAAIGLNYFNGHPAITFVGDVGTLAMGAVIGAGVIIGGLELAGVVAIAPALYEGGATFYYSMIKKIERKKACARPIIDEENKLHPPKGAEKFTLAFLILSKKPMTEKNLVRTILSIYIICGVIAIILSTL